jgi:Zn-dependent peptidase ImmA (M78 family)/transcriptional regulator with XRE-family HTH domain
MSSQQRAFVTGAIIRWARERARIKQDQIARTLHVPTDTIASWELEKELPTIHQAERLAETLHIPLGYLFLPSPPVEKLPLPDFRTIRSAEAGVPSAALIDLLNDVMVKQEWYREFLLEDGAEPLPFVGRFSIQDGTEQVAENIRQALKIDTTLRQQCNSWSEFFRTIIRRAESAGILVMRAGTVSGNSRRPLSIVEFRGFAISDPIAPVVFVNVRDWPVAQLFTLVHELAHIWIGAGGISNETLEDPTVIGHQMVERFCNNTAAEVLVPRVEFLQVWSKDRTFDDNIDIATSGFKVSSLVAARRAFDLQMISRRQYMEHFAMVEQRFKNRPPKKKAGGHGVLNIIARNGETLSSTVVSNALEGRMLYRDAARLLHVSVPAVRKIAEYLAKKAA